MANESSDQEGISGRGNSQLGHYEAVMENLRGGKVKGCKQAATVS